MTIKEALDWATNELKGVCERPFFEASLLLAFHLKQERTYLFTHENEEVLEFEDFKKIVRERSCNKPIEYITNRVSFYDIELFVEEGALIPRPETELLIDAVSRIIADDNITKIAEIGIGSGAISIVLARKFPQLYIIATDISSDALVVAKKNIQNFHLEKQIEVRQANLLDGVGDDIGLIVSNPPYIADDFLLAKNVVDFEPKEALFGGKRGDEVLRQIIDVAKKRGVAYLACEMGYDQKDYIAQYLSSIKIKSVQFYQDLSGLDRGFIIQFKE